MVVCPPCCSPKFLELIDNGKYSLDDIVDQDGNPYTKLANFIKSEFKKYKYTQQDLHTAIKSNNEILIHYPCDYYLLSVDSAGKALDVKDIYCKKVYAALQSVFNETD